MDTVALAAASLITPVIVTNAEAFTITRRAVDCAVGTCEALMTLGPVAGEAVRCSDDGTLVEQAVTLSLPHGIPARPAARLGERAPGSPADLTPVHAGKPRTPRTPVTPATHR